jgi:hypothetical protein
MVATRDRHAALTRTTRKTSRKTLRGLSAVPRQSCHDFPPSALAQAMNKLGEKCAQTSVAAKFESTLCMRLDDQAAMLQAISIGRGFPMLEPWIINEIRRREEERRRGDRPQLELPLPDREWQEEGDFGNARNQQGDRAPERGVVIIGM